MSNLIDLTYLKTVMEEDIEGQIQSIQSFLSQTPILLADLHQALVAKDYPLSAKSAHKIKSSLLLVGMHSTREEMIHLEQMCKQELGTESSYMYHFNLIKDLLKEGSDLLQIELAALQNLTSSGII